MTWLISIVTSLALFSGATATPAPQLDIGPPTPSSADARPLSGTHEARDEAAPQLPLPTPTRPALELVDVSAAQASSVRRVIGLFDAAGLELPPLLVRGSDDHDECAHRGFHRKLQTRSEIVLCASDAAGFERSVVVHELAHAWAAFELGSTAKAAFQQLRGWEHWRDYELADWDDNGTEQAAEVIAWGVYDRVAPVMIDHHGCDDLRTSYRALTGLDPAQGLTTLCEPSPARVYS